MVMLREDVMVARWFLLATFAHTVFLVGVWLVWGSQSGIDIGAIIGLPFQGPWYRWWDLLLFPLGFMILFLWVTVYAFIFEGKEVSLSKSAFFLSIMSTDIVGLILGLALGIHVALNIWMSAVSLGILVPVMEMLVRSIWPRKSTGGFRNYILARDYSV